MKKFVTVVIVLLVLFGLGFFFGWAQMGVPPDAYGVIRSKSHGLDAQLVKPGEFRWVWYKLIPTNAKTAVFRLDTVSREFSARGMLPSGRIYSAFIDIEDDFSWDLRAVISFSLLPDDIIPLISENNIGTQEELARYQSTIAEQMESFILRRMDFNEEFASQIEILLKDNVNPVLEREILRQFPQISNFSLVVKSAKLPDFTLYRQAKGLYEEYIARQKEFISVALEERAKNRIETHYRFDELELYGELLTKYPILIEYLTLEDSRKQSE